MTKMNNIPDWEEKYRDEEAETMPWYYPDLDPDFKDALDRLEMISGDALDIGTGPGTQAIELAKRGFKVTGTDISFAAIEKAKNLPINSDLNLSFMQDDILDSRLNRQFDIALDRGCSHVFPPEKIPNYVSALNGLIKPGGYLLLKCYSHLESEIIGPYCYRPVDIEYCYSSVFTVLSIKDTIYYGPLEHKPKALISVLKKRNET